MTSAPSSAEWPAHGRSTSSTLPDTLEQYLASDDFVERGWRRLFDLADYFAHLVDGRTTGVFATENRDTYLRVCGVATALKATLQWFALDESGRPDFIAEADRYLIDRPQNDWIEEPRSIPDDERRRFRSGPVVPRRGGRGAAGRLHAVTQLKRELVEILRPLDQDDVREHFAAFSEPPHKTEQGWLLAYVLGDQVLISLFHGTCADLLREHGFEWSWDENRSAVAKAINGVLLDANIANEPAVTRDLRLEALAERAIRTAFSALGVAAPRDLFRERRER